MAYKKRLNHKARYNVGKLITNQKLLNLMKDRKYGVTDKAILEFGNFVNNFECLVCDRVAQNFKMSEVGFTHPLSHQASSEILNCDHPKTVSSYFSDISGEEDTFWKEHYAQTFVESLILKKKFENHEHIKDLNTVLANQEVSTFLKSFIADDFSQKSKQDLQKAVENIL